VRRRFYRPRFEFDFARLKDIVVQAAPFGLAMFFVVLYGRIGVLMLKALGTSSDVALFNVGYMLSQPLGFISTALSMAAFPAIARHAQRGPQAIASALRRTSKYQFLVTFPIMAGLVLLSDRVIPLLFHGADFRGASLSLRIMSLGLTLIFVNLMSRYLLAAIDQQRIYLLAVVAGFVANIVLGFLLIPRFGFAGACIAQLAGETSIFVMCQRRLTHYVPARELAGTAVRPALAALGMSAVVLLLRDLPLVVPIVAGAVVYAGLLWLVRAFTPEERELLRGMLGVVKSPRVAAVRRAAPRS
jgi:O-antigen/teichoic acid export membrane protein